MAANKRGKLNDGSKIDEHILSPYCPLTSHHLISHSLFYKVSTPRQKQMHDHHYNFDKHKNLVLLPSKDESKAKIIACYYALPWHSSGHTGNQIIKHYNNSEKGKAVGKSDNPFGGNKAQGKGNNLTEDELKMYNADAKKLEKTKGYHKVVSSLFLTVLKKLKCNQSNSEYQGYLDSLSEDICSLISDFDLLLSNPGYDFASGQDGCNSSGCGDREHTKERTVGLWLSDYVISAYVNNEAEDRLNLLSELQG